MEKRHIPGESLSNRLGARHERRPRIGFSPAFYARWGLEDPWLSGPAAGGSWSGLDLVMLSSSAYYRKMMELATARQRREQRIERFFSSFGHQMPVTGRRTGKSSLRTLGISSFPIDSMVLPPPAVEPKAEEEVAPQTGTTSGWSKSKGPTARVARNPWLSPKAAPARVIRSLPRAPAPVFTSPAFSTPESAADATPAATPQVARLQREVARLRQEASRLRPMDRMVHRGISSPAEQLPEVKAVRRLLSAVPGRALRPEIIEQIVEMEHASPAERGRILRRVVRSLGVAGRARAPEIEATLPDRSIAPLAVAQGRVQQRRGGRGADVPTTAPAVAASARRALARAQITPQARLSASPVTRSARAQRRSPTPVARAPRGRLPGAPPRTAAAASTSAGEPGPGPAARPALAQGRAQETPAQLPTRAPVATGGPPRSTLERLAAGEERTAAELRSPGPRAPSVLDIGGPSVLDLGAPLRPETAPAARPARSASFAPPAALERSPDAEFAPAPLRSASIPSASPRSASPRDASPRDASPRDASQRDAAPPRSPVALPSASLSAAPADLPPLTPRAPQWELEQEWMEVEAPESDWVEQAEPRRLRLTERVMARAPEQEEQEEVEEAFSAVFSRHSRIAPHAAVRRPGGDFVPAQTLPAPQVASAEVAEEQAPVKTRSGWGGTPVNELRQPRIPRGSLVLTEAQAAKVGISPREFRRAARQRRPASALNAALRTAVAEPLRRSLLPVASSAGRPALQKELARQISAAPAAVRPLLARALLLEAPRTPPVERTAGQPARRPLPAVAPALLRELSRADARPEVVEAVIAAAEAGALSPADLAPRLAHMESALRQATPSASRHALARLHRVMVEDGRPEAGRRSLLPRVAPRAEDHLSELPAAPAADRTVVTEPSAAVRRSRPTLALRRRAPPTHSPEVAVPGAPEVHRVAAVLAAYSRSSGTPFVGLSARSAGEPLPTEIREVVTEILSRRARPSPVSYTRLSDGRMLETVIQPGVVGAEEKEAAPAQEKRAPQAWFSRAPESEPRAAAPAAEPAPLRAAQWNEQLREVLARAPRRAGKALDHATVRAIQGLATAPESAAQLLRAVSGGRSAATAPTEEMVEAIEEALHREAPRRGGAEVAPGELAQTIARAISGARRRRSARGGVLPAELAAQAAPGQISRELLSRIAPSLRLGRLVAQSDDQRFVPTAQLGLTGANVPAISRALRLPFDPIVVEPGSFPTPEGGPSAPRVIAGASAWGRPRAGLEHTLGSVERGEAVRDMPTWAQRAAGEPLVRGTGQDFVAALARAESPDDVVRVIVERGAAMGSAASSLPRPMLHMIEAIRSEARATADKAEGSSAPAAAGAPASHTPSRPHQGARVVRGMVSLGGSSARTQQGVGADRVTRLAQKLQQLIHLAEGARKRGDARRQVRMAEDSAAARNEGSASPSQPAGGRNAQVDIDALVTEVLQQFSNKMAQREELRKEDPNGRFSGW